MSFGLLALEVLEIECMSRPEKQVKTRLKALEKHLRDENQLLVKVVNSYRALDQVGYGLGLITTEQSYALQISWWPMISLLGPFSAGKSSFLNSFLKMPLQEHGAQAVDDKFTVICYGKETRTLPGAALDADPRFPFYQIRDKLDKVEAGEGEKINSYLQLRTCPSEQAMGRILIDSPGFDADSQRTATLRITDDVMELSDLVLVLFDARRPEPGAMRDTLQHLVDNTVHRRDASKFMYILNQIDTTADEDNPEAIVAAWQRAIGREGLTTGKFYTIYNPDQGRRIENDAVRQRFESKRDEDLAQIYERISDVGVDRYYSAVARLEKAVDDIRHLLVPKLVEMRKELRKGMRWRTGLIVLLAIAVFVGGTVAAGYWEGYTLTLPWTEPFGEGWWITAIAAVVFVLPFLYIHHLLKKGLARKIGNTIANMKLSEIAKDQLSSAWRKNTRGWVNTLSVNPTGWNVLARRKLNNILNDADQYIQDLNDHYTDPSGRTAMENGKRRPEPVTPKITPAAALTPQAPPPNPDPVAAAPTPPAAEEAEAVAAQERAAAEQASAEQELADKEKPEK